MNPSFINTTESHLHPIISFCRPFEYIEACQNPTIQAGRRHWERQAEARCVGIHARCLLGGVQVFDDFCRRNRLKLHFPLTTNNNRKQHIQTHF